jgi:hypothetical protein
VNVRLLVALGAVLAAAGCGTTPGVTGPSTPHPSGSPATATAALPPPPPLAVIRTDSSVAVVDGTGQTQWSISNASVNRLLATGVNDDTIAQTAGGNVFLFGFHLFITKRVAGSVAVLDRGGNVMGLGSFDSTVLCCEVSAGPSGKQWAWSVDDSVDAPDGAQHHGRIMVEGLGIAAHSVYAWVAPVGSTERVGAWTDMGIVMQRVSLGGCGLGFHPDTASFLVDPLAGTLSSLFTGQAYLDASHRVRVALSASSQSVVVVDGVDHNQAGTIVEAAYVSPDGTLVGVARLTPVPCVGGDQSARVSTQLITVATGRQAVLPGCEILGWFDATDFVCAAFNSTTDVLRDLEGNAGATLGKGLFVGVLQSPP